MWNCTVVDLVAFISHFIFPHVFAQRKYDIELRNELNDLKEKMTGLSIMNEFAKYAKLQRRCNQLENILKKNMDERLSWRLKLQMLLTYSFHILNGILILLLLYIYKKEPVIILSEGTLWPLQDVLSWPCQHENAISLLVWIMIVRLGVSACIKLRV
ncbi:tail-anchored protein insertion receptor WRB-like isoform X2 [Camponotus floridanus]|uniref:tail-anchored protein insertion receptor WRB-like isoform X2 n=1 Tax=Camponotus floridanus TaxID=104421 RepID=UPI000DC67040|nr:tail-anchored protein insertion receptor WRB-like isoform X2 [Camponotus floridanus]